MEVELGKSEVPALAELKDLCRHECTAERYADTVREFGWSLEHVLEDMKTPEMCRRALEACLTAYLNYPGMIHAHPHVVPQPVDSYYNVYSLCRLMEQMTGEKFTCGQMADFYGGKRMAVKCIEVPDGFLKDREVLSTGRKRRSASPLSASGRSRGSRNSKSRNGTTHPRGATE